MIKIEEHLNSAVAVQTLAELANSHWDFLNPKLKNKTGYYQNSLIEKCQKFKNQSNQPGYIASYANNNLAEAKRHTLFFEYLLEKDNIKLKDLIVGLPSKLAIIKNEIMAILLESDIYIVVNDVCCQTPFGKLLSDSIFNYNAYRSSDFFKKLMVDLNFESSTCPYCNDNRIQVIELNKNDKLEQKRLALLDMDHFYPKALNPFFAVSFYNLIPTCHDCNSRIKGVKDFSIGTHINPYHEAFDDFYSFRLSLMTNIGHPKHEIEIVNLGRKVNDRTANDLLLQPRYSTSDKIQAAEALVNYFIKYKHYVGTECEEMFRDFFIQGRNVPIFKNDILRSELGKLKRDILKAVDINNILGIN